MQLFFADELTPEHAVLGKDESHHASRVLRLETGAEVLVTQGRGIIYKAHIRELSKTKSLLAVSKVYSEEKRDRYLHIAIGPTKSLDRFEFFLEKATELGIDEITPLISFHSERKVYKTDRGKKVIQAAVKQSMSNWLPVLNEPLPFNQLLGKPGSNRFIAHCNTERERMPLLPKIAQLKESLVLIGPEGDFSPDEIETAVQAGFTEVSLGEKRLRTETAGLAVALAASL